ncbi:Short-chain dehydrogenase/reductase SDR [Labilithrix luteola]|uniref:Short-chain dehydrogenase/reductase SDR n=1 Tax=Labilithrix luteola TaxID=1391654 RepID=A0A0K1PNF6_9BACT|nr:SDR family oxidoreductase [Labilithrix luteola]AKU95047.1 Short-chain dehydrogenase/reductase SDR [Labilithrix luteola]
MNRTYVVTGAASGIGAATTRYLRERGARVVTSDLRDADVLADLATAQGRAALVEGVMSHSEGRIDAIVANAGGGPPETSLSLNFFGAVATLDGLRPLLERSPAPRAVVVSSVASLRPARAALIDACSSMDEAVAIATARAIFESSERHDDVQVALDLYASAKQALERWCRKVATEPRWAGAGIPLNVVALGFFDTPAAAYVLSNPESRAAMARLAPLSGAFPGRADEAAAVLAWCISPENSQMTGQILFVDGGIECQARGAGSP